ncbi:DNA repair protein [Deinococcus aerophilus]|uniref:DNA repair protein PprA n=1 Tax=Deinococcus aerophilus TaxID=522488 RepID=A0ABQ2GLE7_9DEIO|nr:DNA repair protein [Deinococcus aerophilus]GGM01174.1 DNA repair protein PprA [Deinococcus aerophilus]
MARVKQSRESRTTSDPFTAFDALLGSAGLPPQFRTLNAGGELSGDELDTALTAALQLAHDRWGLGLHHLRHEARVVRRDEGSDIALLTDGHVTAHLSDGAAQISAAYEVMRATDDRGLSMWGTLPDGPRVSADAPFARLKVLIEDARDFETHWMEGRQGLFTRLWRAGETLSVEAARPASPQTALSDAAWDVITGIKDRTFQRELMRRSEEVGMLGALLGARHAGAGAQLAGLPEAHFSVQACVHRLSGPQARDAEAVRAALRAVAAELDELQAVGTRELAAVLKHGLTDRS